MKLTKFIKAYWPAFAGVFFAFALALVLFLIRSNLSQIPDFPTRQILKNEQTKLVHIPEAASGLDIAKELYQNGITASITAFYQLAISEPKAMTIAPGEYALNSKIAAEQALQQLLDKNRIQGLISVIEGDWRSEIFALMAKNGFNNLELSATKLKVPEGFNSLEGIYFPAQYSFQKGTTSQEALQKMVDRFVTEAQKLAWFDRNDPYNDLIMASLIQAEGEPENFAKVSRVIYNRLKIGMPLQLDATVQYALKKRGSIWVTTAATKIQSPYNTYRYYGLPKAPIGNPGVAALKAVIEPAAGDWLYFITVKPGDTRFTKSHDEFLKWKIEYEKNVRAGLFK